MNFGEKLKSLREQKNLTQVDLAKELGVTQRTISYYENGKGIPSNPEILNTLAKLFEVTLDYLLLDTKTASNSKWHRLLKKLISDTSENKLKWDSLNIAVYTESTECGHTDVYYIKNFSVLTECLQYESCTLDHEQSFYCNYNRGGYLLAKITLISKNVIIALFVLHEKKFHYIADMNSITEIEDLYLMISETPSDIDKFIDEYLNDESILF